MPIDNLALVTQKIMDVIASAEQFHDPPDNPSIPVFLSVISPQDVQKTYEGTKHNVISVYLFHMREDADFKNQFPKIGSGLVPVQQIPLGLNLYYVVNAHDPQTADLEERGKMEQTLIGIVAKALHDNPVLRLDTPAGKNSFQIILRPVPIEEAIQFWASDETRLTRPSIYLEARVIFIEPEAPQLIPGIVLSVNSPLLAGFGPQLTTSTSVLSFEAPKVGLRKLNAEPARVALFGQGQTFPPPIDPDVAADLLNNNLVTIEGTGFGAGPTFLELSRADVTVRLDLLHAAPPGQPSWVVAVGSDKITLRVWTSIFDVMEGRNVPTDFFPGTYTARFIDNGLPLPFVSNEIAFSVVPQIVSLQLRNRIVLPSNPNVYTLTVSGNYLFFALAELQIQLVVGKNVLVQVPALNPSLGLEDPAEGEYVVQPDGTIDFHRKPVSGEVIDDDHPLPVTLIINGATATPVWITGNP